MLSYELCYGLIMMAEINFGINSVMNTVAASIFFTITD